MRPVPREKKHQNPGAIATLMAGFDLITRHIWLILLPFVLDLIYWLGPRLSIEDLARKAAEVIQAEQSLVELSEQLVQLSTGVNLVTALSVPLIGVPALMNGPIPDKAPISASVHQVGGTFQWILLFICFSLIGLGLTALYLSLISISIRESQFWHGLQIRRLTMATFRSTYRLLGLALLFVIALVMVWLPLMPVTFLLSFLGNNLFLIVLFLGFIFVATYLSLAVPSIVFQENGLLTAISESIRTVHKNLLPTVNILLLLILIGSGMNLLWHMADDGSWLTLVSIAGHAFISTALMATFIIYYRNRTSMIVEEEQ